MADDGAGIPPEILPHVFERFARADDSRAHSAAHSTGLGLAIVKHVAANHNGSIRLWSKPGTGSTFTLSIPSYPGPDTGPDIDLDSGFDAEAGDPVIPQGEEQHIR